MSARRGKPQILVVGGAGYIGSAMVRVLVDAGESPVVFDNLSMGHRDLVPKGVPFVRGDLKKPSDIRRAFSGRRIESVMHFAASSLVGESVENPLKYYENNVVACVYLLKEMTRRGVKNFIFSSTAATYGEPRRIPVREEDAGNPTNPYGQSKLMIEKILQDLSRKGDIRYIALRYFNACGAHACGTIGERHDPETHLIPNILKTLTGEKKALKIFGTDYPTPDGTCIRDYVHVEDLADAHLRALRTLRKGAPSGAFNLGSSSGYSVKQIVSCVERVTGMTVPVQSAPRRPGDPARLVADARRAKKYLGWRPCRGLDEIVRSAWAWERRERR